MGTGREVYPAYHRYIDTWLAEIPKCWTREFQKHAIVADNFVYQHEKMLQIGQFAEILDLSILGFQQACTFCLSLNMSCQYYAIWKKGLSSVLSEHSYVHVLLLISCYLPMSCWSFLCHVSSFYFDTYFVLWVFGFPLPFSCIFN